MDSIKIKCNSLNPQETVVLDSNGKEITGIKSIDIKMRPDKVNTAELCIIVDEINIQANPLLSFDTVKECAEYYGCELVVKGTK